MTKLRCLNCNGEIYCVKECVCLDFNGRYNGCNCSGCSTMRAALGIPMTNDSITIPNDFTKIGRAELLEFVQILVKDRQFKIGMYAELEKENLELKRMLNKTLRTIEK